MGDPLRHCKRGKAMQKTGFAALFLGLCALVVVLHVQDNSHAEEEVAKFEDPFLKKLEMHVIRNAQARLAKREAKQARIAHINEARKAMKNSLMMAETTAVKRVKKVEKEVKKAKVKKYSWNQLQRGDDEAKENYTVNKVGNLLKDLKSAPKATKENLKAAAKASAQSKIDAMGDALKRAKQETATAAKERKENDVFGDDY